MITRQLNPRVTVSMYEGEREKLKAGQSARFLVRVACPSPDECGCTGSPLYLRTLPELSTATLVAWAPINDLDDLFMPHMPEIQDWLVEQRTRKVFWHKGRIYDADTHEFLIAASAFLADMFIEGHGWRRVPGYKYQAQLDREAPVMGLLWDTLPALSIEVLCNEWAAHCDKRGYWGPMPSAWAMARCKKWGWLEMMFERIAHAQFGAPIANN